MFDKKEKLQNGHSIEEHHKKFHLDENYVRNKVPNFMNKSQITKCMIKSENVFCAECSRFFDSSASLDVHLNIIHSKKVVA